MTVNKTGNISYGKERSLCNTALNFDAKILTVASKQRCRYHAKNSEIFNSSQFTPDGLCIHAFHAIYPSCLKVLYTEKNNNIESSIVCPDTEGAVEFEVFGVKHSDITRRLYNSMKCYLRRLGIPCDYQLKRIIIKVTCTTGKCPKGHKKSDTFEFNLGGKSEICPASFESIYPSISSLGQKNSLNLTDGEGHRSVCMVCPSHKVSINYKII